jgi:hypothetical protein
MNSTTSTVTLPFGKHRNCPLSEVPSHYLTWLASTCRLSSGLKAAVHAELRERGEPVPAGPHREHTVPVCRRCPGAGFRCCWRIDAMGRRTIRASCQCCDRHLSFAPCVPPFTDLADASEQDARGGQP